MKESCDTETTLSFNQWLRYLKFSKEYKHTYLVCWCMFHFLDQETT